jgi:hypothetical protein
VKRNLSECSRNILNSRKERKEKKRKEKKRKEKEYKRR